MNPPPVLEFAILAARGMLVLAPDSEAEGEVFRVLGTPPSWLSRFVPEPAPRLTIPATFPYLEVFLEEARRYWANPSGEAPSSGTWIEADREGRERGLDATALLADGEPLLLVEMHEAPFEERKAALQWARETALAYERLELETALLVNRNRVVERSNELKTEFLASMSHELRTPLNAMIGFSQLLLKEKAGPLNPRQRDFVQHSLRASQHLLELINDVLDLAKIEAGQLAIQPQCIALRDAVNEVADALRPLIAAKGLAFAASLNDVFAVHADPIRLKQILYNLLSNAIKFTNPGGSIAVTAELRGEAAEITVTDNGIGIAQADQARIFEKFHQVRSPKTASEGTGLGLTITKRLVEMHGGEIGVRSAPGVGSSFSFRLPAV